MSTEIELNLSDRVSLRSSPEFRFGGWLHLASGCIETVLSNDRFVIKLNMPITQQTAIDLGYCEGYAVVHRSNLRAAFENE